MRSTLRLEILDEADEIDLPSSRSRWSEPSPAAILSSDERDENRWFFRPPGQVISNKHSVLDTDGSTNRSHHDDIFDLVPDYDQESSPSKIICYEEFIVGPEPPSAPKSRTNKVFRFTDQMFEETGSTSAPRS
jgi:hypothetical protein